MHASSIEAVFTSEILVERLPHMCRLLAKLLVKYVRTTRSHPGRGLILKAAYNMTMAQDAAFVLVENVNGFRMLVSRHDKGIGKELRRYRVHEPTCTALLSSLLSSGMKVLDVGANIGYYTLLEARAVGTAGQVIAVEPHPDNLLLLRHNLRLNGYPDVKIIHAAISDSPGRVPLFVSHKSNWHTICADAGHRARHAIEVEAMTIDDVSRSLQCTFNLLRMDLEGGELKALRGASNTLATARPKLVMEVHPKYLGRPGVMEILALLHDVGYEVTYFLLRQDDRTLLTWGQRTVLMPSLSDLLGRYADLILGDDFLVILEGRT